MMCRMGNDFLIINLDVVRATKQHYNFAFLLPQIKKHYVELLFIYAFQFKNFFRMIVFNHDWKISFHIEKCC